MQIIKTLSLTSAVSDWLANTHHPRILHVFDHACNLINERREVLSVVTREIGDGPFNLVIEDDICFSDYLSLESPVSNFFNQINLGNMTINTTSAKLWNPRPNWEELHNKRKVVLHQIHEIASSQTALLVRAGITNYQLPITKFSNSLISSLALADLPSSLTSAQQLAGWGIGLTPAGDDFIMGALYAVWIIHPPEIASVLAKEIAETAAPLTTSLSAAWLRSAGRGEVGILWHEFFDGLIAGDSSAIQLQITKLLSIGHTSGADALAGFMSTFISYAESETKPCPS